MAGRFPVGSPFGFRSDFNPVPRRPYMTSGSFTERNNTLLDSPPSILLQAVIVPGDKTLEGQLVEAVALPWFQIIELVSRVPESIYEIDWRKWEEIIAGALSSKGMRLPSRQGVMTKGRRSEW